MWMVQSGEDLSLFTEATQDEVRVHPAFDELDGRSLVEFVVCARGFVNGAHAAASNLPLDTIGAETSPNHRVFVFDKRLEHAHFGIAVNGFFE